MQSQDVRWLQIENTTRCNASCSVCNRNDYGFNLAPGVSLIDLGAKQLESALEMFPNLEFIEFCGNRGDAIAAKNLTEQLDVVVKHLTKFNNIKVSFSTNGSLRSSQWWKDFAIMLADTKHEVIFAIDGLEDTNHIYRQRPKFKTIIDNAVSFISLGGQAVWKFIPFQHNEHQILNALKMSRALGFVDFRFVKNPIVPAKTYDWIDKKFIKIHSWSQQRELPANNTINADDCNHLKLQQVYLNASGYFHLCCHLHFDHGPVECNFEELPDVDKTFEYHPSNFCLEKCGRYVNIG